MTNEELLDSFAKNLPNKGVWRWKEGEVFKTKANLLVAIRKMRKAKLEDKDIQDIIEDTFYAAFAERDLIFKEKAGITCKEAVEYFAQRKQEERIPEQPVQNLE